MCGKVAIFIITSIFVLSSIKFAKSHHSRTKSINHISNTTMLRPINRPNVQRQIVRHHNRFRSMVQPPASNMLRMKWHKDAARSAQKWADQCKFLTHDTAKGRHDKNFGACGQNIFVSTHPTSWLFAMKAWHSEKKDFVYGGNTNVLKDVGHYTQMVWASSQFVGCGFAKCNKNSGFTKSTYYSYVCNYCPSGNKHGKVGTPYASGKSCKSCPKSCKNKLCLNGCNFSNVYANCDDLYRQHSDFVCRSFGHNCKATCKCIGKIYE